MDAAKKKVEQAQKIRVEINKIITSQIIPRKERYERLLDDIAVMLCPFRVNESITLPNNKKGRITEIRQFSLTPLLENIFAVDLFGDEDKPAINPEYIYTTELDEKEFSITWCISGVRIKADGKDGLSRFVDLSPVHRVIDEINKRISDKQMGNYVSEKDYVVFDDLKT